MRAERGERRATDTGAVAGDMRAVSAGMGAGVNTGAVAASTDMSGRMTSDTGAARTGTGARETTDTGSAASSGVRVGAAGARGLDLDKLYTARLHAARARPYLATALFALHTVESRRVPTMGVDRYWRCYVSPDFVDRMPVEQLAGVWVHEVSHLLRDHHGRSDRVAKERGLTGPGERLRMNIAADCEINDDAFGDGLVKPEGAVTPAFLRLPEGQLMEDYLRQFQLGTQTGEFAWLDCGSGADGLEREWELGRTGHVA